MIKLKDMKYLIVSNAVSVVIECENGDWEDIFQENEIGWVSKEYENYDVVNIAICVDSDSLEPHIHSVIVIKKAEEERILN